MTFRIFFNIRVLKNRYRQTGCVCKIHVPIATLNDPSTFIVKGIHRHSGDARKIGKAIAMAKLKDGAINTRAPTREVVTKAIRGLDKPTLATMASEKSLVKMVNRKRNKDTHPKNPSKASELVLTEIYRTTIKGENFLLYDSSVDYGDDERFLVLGTAENLKFLARCGAVYMDGTFSVVPVIFAQLYTIHGMYAQ